MESEHARDAGVPACTQLLPCALSGSLFGCGRQPDVCSTALKVATRRLNRGTTEWLRLGPIDLFLKRDFFFYLGGSPVSCIQGSPGCSWRKRSSSAVRGAGWPPTAALLVLPALALSSQAA